eukprot:442638-Amphidinium_carterae.1
MRARCLIWKQHFSRTAAVTELHVWYARMIVADCLCGVSDAIHRILHLHCLSLLAVPTGHWSQWEHSCFLKVPETLHNATGQQLSC